MTDTTNREVPQHLIDAILAGRCVALVGAGFSANAPPWGALLKLLGAELGPVKAQVEELLGENPRAFELEAAGQLVRDAFPGDQEFEECVQRVLRAYAVDRHERMGDRQRHLAEIPFAAVLTTNYDENFEGEVPHDAYARVLRQQRKWYRRAHWGEGDRGLRAVKLHGDANGRHAENPIVLAKKDYRRLLYGGGTYGNFLRSVYATRTVLHIGVSFSDAYLNELRSEVLAMVRPGPRAKRDNPVGYAVLDNRTPEVCEYFREHEGIKILNYEQNGHDYSGFDEWLAAIWEKTAPAQRLRALLKDQTIVWVDPNVEGNRKGYSRFVDPIGVGAKVLRLDSQAQLEREKHAEAKLLITHFGYRAPGESEAFDLLERVNAWGVRPPVIIFCDENHDVENRREVLRRGAFELTSRWGRLFEAIERLFGRG